MKQNFLLKKSVIASSLALAFAYSAFAQDVTPVPGVQKVTITGSNIKRIDYETTTPVQIVKREDIERLGANSVQDIINSLTASTGSLSDIGGSSSFAGGASSASLRNMGKQSTLILLNNRRVAPYALADYNEVFTNLDSLPIDAIERVEVLRSGGSAVYGSDAVAGVINIITRANYNGVQAKVSRDQSRKNKKFSQDTASITGGFGNLDTDHYNILANLEVYQRKSVMWRDVVDDVNPRYADFFASMRPGSGLMFGNRGTPSTFSYPGNIIGQGAIDGCTTRNGSGLCIFDRYSRFQVQPKAERSNLLLSGKFDLGSGLQAYSEVLYSKTRTSYTDAFAYYDSTGNDIIWGDPRSGAQRSFVYQYLPASHPLNKTGDEAPLRYRFADSGASRVSDSSQYRVLAGLKGSWKQYEWDAAVGMMGSSSNDRSRGAISDSGFKKVIGNYVRDPVTGELDPQFFNRDYKIGKPNSAEVLNTLFPLSGYDGKIKQEFVDAKMSGTITTWDGRPIDLAMGADLRHESFLITPTDNLMQGDVVGNGAVSANAGRTNSSLFAELNVPVTKEFEMQAAARLDKFPGFAAHLSPKLAARYEVNKSLMFRGTVETGFRAPNLTESAQSSKFAFDSGVQDPKRCSQAQALAGDLRTQSDALPASDPNKSLLAARADIVEGNECASGVASRVRNNPNLKPEVSRSATFGFVIEPTKNSNLSIDYFNIVRRDEIGLKTTQDLLAAEDSWAPGTVNRQSLSQDKTFSAAERAQYGVKVGSLASTSGQFENVSKTKTSGFDFGAAMRFTPSIGRVDVGFNSTYLRDLEYFSVTRKGYGDNLAGRYGHSKWTSNLTANLQSGSFNNGLRLNYASATSLHSDYYDDVYTADGCTAKKWSADVCQVKAYSRWDYNFSYTGVKNVTISAIIGNLTNKRPPIDLRSFNEGGGGIIPQSSEDVMGRTLRLNLQYKFY